MTPRCPLRSVSPRSPARRRGSRYGAWGNVSPKGDLLEVRFRVIGEGGKPAFEGTVTGSAADPAVLADSVAALITRGVFSAPAKLVQAEDLRFRHQAGGVQRVSRWVIMRSPASVAHRRAVLSPCVPARFHVRARGLETGQRPSLDATPVRAAVSAGSPRAAPASTQRQCRRSTGASSRPSSSPPARRGSSSTTRQCAVRRRSERARCSTATSCSTAAPWQAAPWARRRNAGTRGRRLTRPWLQHGNISPGPGSGSATGERAGSALTQLERWDGGPEGSEIHVPDLHPNGVRPPLRRLGGPGPGQRVRWVGRPSSWCWRREGRCPSSCRPRRSVSGRRAGTLRQDAGSAGLGLRRPRRCPRHARPPGGSAGIVRLGGRTLSRSARGAASGGPVASDPRRPRRAWVERARSGSAGGSLCGR